MGVGVLRLGGGRRLSCSDGPYWLIGDHGFQELLGANSSEAAAQLFLQYLLFSASFPFFERFSDAQNRLQLVGVGRKHLLVDEGIGFPENLPPFAVANDDIFDKELPKHGRADFTGVSA